MTKGVLLQPSALRSGLETLITGGGASPISSARGGGAPMGHERAIRRWTQRTNASHPYGHGKAESIVAVAVALLLLGAAAVTGFA